MELPQQNVLYESSLNTSDSVYHAIDSGNSNKESGSTKPNSTSKGFSENPDSVYHEIQSDSDTKENKSTKPKVESGYEKVESDYAEADINVATNPVYSDIYSSVN